MLHLPVGGKGRFTKDQLAEMARGGATVRVREKSQRRDPVIAAVKFAGDAANRVVEACGKVWVIKQKLKSEDFGFLMVHPIDEEPIFRHFTHGYVFCSVKHIKDEFRRGRVRARQCVKHYKLALKRRPDHPLALEWKQSIEAEKQLIANLSKYEPAQIAAFKKEAIRLYAVQSKAGLIAAREQGEKAFKRFEKAFARVESLTPTTADGAVALVAFCATIGHMRSIYPNIHQLNKNMGGMLSAASSVLAREHQSNQGAALMAKFLGACRAGTPAARKKIVAILQKEINRKHRNDRSHAGAR